MIKFRIASFAAAAAAALISTTSMAKDAPSRFTHDGVTYVYTTAATGGRTVIDGRALPGGDAFHLIVRADRVTGDVAGRSVSFTVRDATGARLLLAAK